MIKVHCKVCNKPVPELSYHYRQINDDYVFTAKCHGKFDRAVFPHQFLRGNWRIKEVEAFGSKPTVIEGSCIELSSTTKTLALPNYYNQEEKIVRTREPNIGVETN